MITKINRVEELEAHFSKYSTGYLFRGQIQHYLNPQGDTNIPTSFSRHRCVPNIMFKWTHYSKAIIRAFSGADYFNIDSERSQAILQHYGWRSFYVDLTKAPHIACWFASNIYEESRSIHMSEDLDENPVWLVHKNAKYREHDGAGHIYIIDCLTLESLGVKIHDLTSMESDEGRLRFHAQQACLAGNLNDMLPPQAIASHIEVLHEVLREYCCKNLIFNVSDIFPTRKEDFILNTLLSLPWEKIPIDDTIPAFRRGLEIPDFEDNFTKRLPPSITLYENFWLANNREISENPFKDLIFYKLPQFSYYANTNDPFELDMVNHALKKHGDFVIELDGLVKIIESHEAHIYEKGIHVSIDEAGFIQVSGLLISHPSNIVEGVGTNVGWMYRIKNSFWEKVEHHDQCNCKNDLRHQLQFSLLRILNEALKNKDMVRDGELCYRHKELF